MNHIFSAIAIIASLALFFGYVDPTYGAIKNLQAEKEEYDSALNNSKVLQDQKKMRKAQLEAMLPGNLDALYKLMPDNIDNVRLIIDIDEMAKTHEMKIRNFKTDTTETKDTIGRDSSTYGVLTLTFNTAAPYSTFLTFMRDLERSLRIIDVSSITFTSNETSPIYDYIVTIKTYWLK